MLIEPRDVALVDDATLKRLAYLAYSFGDEDEFLGGAAEVAIGVFRVSLARALYRAISERRAEDRAFWVLVERQPPDRRGGDPSC